MKRKKKTSDTQDLQWCNIMIVHEARLLRRRNLTRNRLATVIHLFPKDIRFLGFAHMFPTGNEGECLLIDRLTYMHCLYQWLHQA